MRKIKTENYTYEDFLVLIDRKPDEANSLLSEYGFTPEDFDKRVYSRKS